MHKQSQWRPIMSNNRCNPNTFTLYKSLCMFDTLLACSFFLLFWEIDAHQTKDQCNKVDGSSIFSVLIISFAVCTFLYVRIGLDRDLYLFCWPLQNKCDFYCSRMNRIISCLCNAWKKKVSNLPLLWAWDHTLGTSEIRDLVDGKFLNHINRIMKQMAAVRYSFHFHSVFHSDNLTIAMFILSFRCCIHILKSVSASDW